ncbi:MAG: phosphatase PAP2 family protein [Thermodesulfobacteriota bacterium]
MKHLLAVIIVLSAVLPGRLASAENIREKLTTDISALKGDYANFYLDTGSMLRLGAGLAGGAFLANTSADREFQEYYRDDLRSSTTDGFSKVFRVPGEPLAAVPVLAALRLAFPLDSPIGLWSQRTLRGIFLGGPAAYLIQNIAGGGRPEEGADTSRWRGPFHNNNSLSGHTFIGALPLITAARMQDDPYLKAMLYAASPLTGLSRINDDKHYVSQVFLGWYLAYMSAVAVEGTGAGKDYSAGVIPLAGNGFLVFFDRRF